MEFVIFLICAVGTVLCWARMSREVYTKKGKVVLNILMGSLLLFTLIGVAFFSTTL